MAAVIPAMKFSPDETPWARWVEAKLVANDQMNTQNAQTQGNSNQGVAATLKVLGKNIVDLGGRVTVAIAAAIAAISLDMSQVPTGNLAASRIAGTVTNPVTTTGNVNAQDINLIGDLYTPHGKITPVTTGYVGAWINGDGRLGASASTRASKRDLTPLTDVNPLLSLQPYLGRYIWDKDDAPLSVFLIAEEVHAAGFGPDVAPTDADGKPFTVNYSQIVVPLLALAQAQQKEILSLAARLDKAGL